MDDILLHNDEYILKARDLMDSWEYILAKRVLEDLLQEDPRHSEGHHLMGQIYSEQLNQYDMAEMHFKMAIKFDKLNIEAFLSYLQLLKNRRNASKMFTLIGMAEMVPDIDKGIILGFKGDAYELLLDFEESAKYYRMAILYSCDNNHILDLECSLDRIKKKYELTMTDKYFINTITV